MAKVSAGFSMTPRQKDELDKILNQSPHTINRSVILRDALATWFWLRETGKLEGIHEEMKESDYPLREKKITDNPDPLRSVVPANGD